MSTAVVDEFVKRARDILTLDELKDLSRRLTEPTPQVKPKSDAKKSEKKGYVSPDTIWIKENSHLYRGQYVAIKEGKFVAAGRTIKEADQAAKRIGVTDPLLHYIFPEDYVPWGGW
ncbi:MAG: DUF5678 domain-containing protein [Pyrinomonadaceae bacterium]